MCIRDRMYATRFKLPIYTSHRLVRARKEEDLWVLEIVVKDKVHQCTCHELVLCTGHQAVPRMPAWTQHSGEDCKILHSSALTPDTLALAKQIASRGKLMLVGFGNSAGDIAAQILKVPATQVYVSIRRVPHIVRRDYVAGVTLEQLVRVWTFVPAPLRTFGDRVMDMVQSLFVLYPAAIWSLAPKFPAGLERQRSIAEHRTPTIDKGPLIRSIHNDRIRFVPALVGLDQGNATFLADAHAPIDVEMAIFCTGYEPTQCTTDWAGLGAHDAGFDSSSQNLLPMHRMLDVAARVTRAVLDKRTRQELSPRSRARSAGSSL
eukprot:TRINITY_DN27616_c0_g1_i1.p1 TRINITY_DN27616_c0_g1~~TRINITY_DN27616_c0_g1_i1.p1  ORF type:complete len:319 (-),score=53.18 TRINITY_DN27616_c0_g1_i1:87-1043(-)